MRDKKVLFDQLLDRVRETLDGPLERDEKLQAVCRLLKDRVVYYDWVGFYLVDESKKALVLGPYAGKPTEHCNISFGSGICGRAAEERKALTVQDVSKETNYLSCDATVKSEIVIPVLKGSRIIGEIDIDSRSLSPFTGEDTVFLEKICQGVSGLF